MEGKRIYDVGPVYAVREYMRQLEANCEIPMHQDGEWYNLLLGITVGKNARCHREFRRSVLEGSMSKRMLSLTESTGRRLGRPTTEFAMLRAGHGEIRHLGGMRTVPGIYICRDYVRLEQDRAEHVPSIPFVFFSTHALERMYEREECVEGGIDEMMRERLTTADGDLAFASITNLWIRGENDVAHQLVPFGDGLLIATIVSYVTPADHPAPFVTRQIFRRNIIDRRPMPIRDELLGTMPEGLTGHSSQILTLARTYLSCDMLRPEQEEYRRLFMDEAAALDRRKMAAALYMPVNAHERKALGEMHASPRLHDLLARSLNADHYPAVWEAGESKREIIEKARPSIESQRRRSLMKIVPARKGDGRAVGRDLR